MPNKIFMVFEWSLYCPYSVVAFEFRGIITVFYEQAKTECYAFLFRNFLNN